MKTESVFNIVLVEPEIPPNTGSIARLCGATDCILHLVHPLGFSTDDKHLKRAGLDYWEHVSIHHWDSFNALLKTIPETKMHLFSTKCHKNFTEVHFIPGDFLIFGKETKGIDAEILHLYNDRCLTLPMKNPNIRSLNLAMTVGIVVYEALRQQGFDR